MIVPPAIFACATLVGSLLAAPSEAPRTTECTPAPIELTTLVPVDATFALGVDVDAVTSSALWGEFEPALRADLRWGDHLRMLDACGVELGRIYGLVAARGVGGETMVAVQGRGIGEPATLECLSRQLAARADGANPWSSGRRDCLDTLELPGGAVFVANPYTLIFADGAWTSAVEARLRGAEVGVPALFEGALSSLDRDRAHAWLLAAPSPAEAARLPGEWATAIAQLGLTLELDDGVELGVVTRSATVAAAAVTREHLIAGLRNLAARLELRGASVTFAEPPRIAVAERRVTTQLRLSRSELLGLRAALAGQIRGRGLF